MFIAIVGRFVAHFLSGIVFFAVYTHSGMHPVVYSVIYKGSYLIGELVVTAFIIYLILKKNLLEIYL